VDLSVKHFCSTTCSAPSRPVESSSLSRDTIASEGPSGFADVERLEDRCCSQTNQGGGFGTSGFSREKLPEPVLKCSTAPCPDPDRLAITKVKIFTLFEIKRKEMHVGFVILLNICVILQSALVPHGDLVFSIVHLSVLSFHSIVVGPC
jgi:hypothetical protein